MEKGKSRSPSPQHLDDGRCIFNRDLDLLDHPASIARRAVSAV
jgi:hypothetical protein